MLHNEPEPSIAGAVRFSLVVATLGRTEPLVRLLRSLLAQTYPIHEIIVVDQNDVIELRALLRSSPLAPLIRHLHVPHVRGVSRARNIGVAAATGDMLLFPDDDCWYPPEYLADAARMLRSTGAALLTGRPATVCGRTINGRFEKSGASITRSNAFTTQIEWNMLVSSDLMQSLGGYDEDISLGGPTPWQGGEGYDLVLRAIAAGARCIYRPELVAHHDELPVARPDQAMISKGRDYGRGLGFVLRKHGFGRYERGIWLARSAFNIAASACAFRVDRFRYFLVQFSGRLEGMRGVVGNGETGTGGAVTQPELPVLAKHSSVERPEIRYDRSKARRPDWMKPEILLIAGLIFAGYLNALALVVA